MHLQSLVYKVDSPAQQLLASASLDSKQTYYFIYICNQTFSSPVNQPPSHYTFSALQQPSQLFCLNFPLCPFFLVLAIAIDSSVSTIDRTFHVPTVQLRVLLFTLHAKWWQDLWEASKILYMLNESLHKKTSKKKSTPCRDGSVHECTGWQSTKTRSAMRTVICTP